jgi:hypothetical protein
MKRTAISRFARRIGLIAGGLTLLVAGPAQAAVNQSFDVTISKVSAAGPYTFSLDWTTTSTDASVAPAVTDVQMKLPKGVEVQRQFLRGACDVNKLRSSRNPSVCKSSQVGTGKIQMDFRPFTGANVPADIYLFLAKGGVAGAHASLAILAVPDAKNSFVAANPVVSGTKPVMQANLFKDPSSGFGYRMELPVDIDAPVLVSVKNFHADLPGIKKGKKFWVSQPNCRSRSAKFQATFTYVGGLVKDLADNVRQRFKCPKTK